MPILLDMVPVATAVGVFGVIYGATASSVMGTPMTLASSVLMFSGAAQFTMVGLVDSGATAVAILLAVGVLALRHLPLAAVVLPRLQVSRRRRALLSLVLTDETAGLAVASARPAGRTLGLVGVAAYGAWLLGTIAGVLGADLLGAERLASVVFVILFIGLSSLTCRSRSGAARAVFAAVTTAGVLLVVPAVGALGAIVVAVGWAATAPGGRA